MATEKKLISAEHVFVDSTHVKASANKHKFEK
ncbi:transposase [Cytobacillus purgationiresistens]|uniref:Transposase n=1 Tax=Cytobacillus purgationiresistens TaxID=863449 RepID=A0ABU0AQ35_9BACI|nr:transposase [Cytobacillus purgationiresistens]